MIGSDFSLPSDFFYYGVRSEREELDRGATYEEMVGEMK